MRGRILLEGKLVRLCATAVHTVVQGEVTIEPYDPHHVHQHLIHREAWVEYDLGQGVYTYDAFWKFRTDCKARVNA